MGLLESIWNTWAVLAPFLLLGLGLAGILHVVVPEGLVQRHLSGKGAGPVLRAMLIGVPLPLCSCGVIPVAQHLRSRGAGRGATASFLASTPSTGADSISATWGMLGPGFALARVAFAAVSGVVAGWLVDRLASPVEDTAALPSSSSSCSASTPAERRSPVRLAREALSHGFGDILFSLRKWLLVGVVLGGLLSWLLPQGAFEGALGNPLFDYLAMMAASGPLYVCATGSIPIAASLVEKGMSPGAALVFLTVGPATNTAMLGFLGASLGRRALVVYVAVVATLAVVAGMVLDFSGILHWMPSLLPSCHSRVSAWEHVAAAVLLLVAVRDFRLPRSRKPKPEEPSMKISIPSIMCANCARHVTQALEPVPGVTGVQVDIAGKAALVDGAADPQALLSALEKAGYPGTRIP